MAPVAVGSAIGAAALTMGRGAVTAVGNGLSFAAELVRATTCNATAAEDRSLKEQSAQAALKQRSELLRGRIQRQLASAGIQLSQPVELISNGQGGIAVAGPHPLAAAIEETLGSDVLLERDFNRLAEDYREDAETNASADRPPMLTITIPKSL